MTVLQALYEVLNCTNSFVIEIKEGDFSFCTGINDKLRLNDKENQIVGDRITIRDVKSFTVQELDDVYETSEVSITFEDSATVKIHCI